MTHEAAVVSARRFRPEIEGLRAVAALLVAAYHIWFGRVSGGVDVFFVIAGFMVTTTLLGHLERTGRIDAGRYLSRLLTRLLPNALVVLTAVALATWCLIPSTRRDEVYTEIAASALYVENWQLAARSVDYLERGYTSSPVQHFWALSIQGQFYLLWLVLFLLVVRFAPGRPGPRLAAAMGVLVAGSFAFSVWYTAIEQPVAYFHTGARVWEFGVGGLLALMLRRWPTWRATPAASFLLGWLGLLAIVSCGALLSVGTSFPGWIALWPVGGAVLILLAGDHPSRLSASAMLSSRPLVRLGSVSYALYLWHWPLLTFVLVWTERDAVGPWAGLAIIGVAILLSFLSTWLVERPVRQLRLDRRRAWGVPALASLVVGAFAATAYALAAVSAVQIPGVATGLDSARYPGALALAPDATPAPTGKPRQEPAPGVAAAPEDIPEVYDAGCHQELRRDELVTCEYGDPESERTMVLTGGSHSAHWQPALKLIAEQRGWRLLSATKSGCRPGTHLVSPDSDDASINRAPAANEAHRRSCRRWNESVVRWVGDLDPDLVVLTSTVVHDESTERESPAYRRMWGELADDDTTVLAIRDTPRPSRDVPDCLASHGATTTRCDVPRGVLRDPDPAAARGAAQDGIQHVEVTDYLCRPRVCPAVVGNIIVYSDSSHLTRTFSKSLSGPLLEVAPVLR